MIIYYSTAYNNTVDLPQPLSSCMFEEIKNSTVSAANFIKCPSFQSYIKNIYVIRSPYDYEFNIDCESGNIKSNMYHQQFFNKHIQIRDVRNGIFSYSPPRIMFFTEHDLEVEQLPPFYHTTLKGHTIVVGKFNIGKHFRPFDMAIQMFHSDTFSFKENSPLYYLKFCTDEKINFQRFFFTEKLNTMMNWQFDRRNFTKRIIPLKWYYENTYKKTILKEIKNNLLK